MKLFTRGLVLVVLSLGMLGLVSCGTDNETEAQKLVKTAADPGPPSPNAIPKTPETAPATEAERGKRMLETQKDIMKGYPGAKK